MSDEFLLYRAPNGAVSIDVLVQDESVWLTQKALGELFGVQRPAVTKHLLNIFATGELVEASVCSVLEHTAADGKTYSTRYYNLDAIIAVGYRVNSFQATQFRIWATRVLREYLISSRRSDADGGLGELSPQLAGAVELPGPTGQRQSQRPPGET